MHNSFYSLNILNKLIATWGSIRLFCLSLGKKIPYYASKPEHIAAPYLNIPSDTRIVWPFMKFMIRGVRGTGRLLREKEVDEIPQGGFPEEAVKKIEGVRLGPSHPVTTSNDPTSCGAAESESFPGHPYHSLNVTAFANYRSLMNSSIK